MIVLDASAVVDLLLGIEPAASRIAERVVREHTWTAPHLIDVEVAQVLRRFVRAGKLEASRAEDGLLDLSEMPLRRYPHTPLLPRVFELRARVTAYDATYLTLAEELDAPLVTRDKALASVSGCRAAVEVL